MESFHITLITFILLIIVAFCVGQFLSWVIKMGEN